MTCQQVYDMCIIGAGLIGSAAARHAVSADSTKKVLVVGPSEPRDRRTTDIFGAHYDEARIYRILDPDPVWAVLGREAVQRFPEIAKESGVSFYHQRGFVKIGPERDQVIEECRSVANKLNLRTLEFKTQEARRKFPYFSFRSGETVLLTPDNSGCLNPRRLLQAQQTLAGRYGCHLVDDVVDCVSSATPGGDLHQLVTGQGHMFLARRILFATGAFTTCRDLLPQHLWPDIINSKHTVVLVEISEKDYEMRLKAMPPLSIERLQPENDEDPKYWTYVIPPIKYPNGKLYIKIGHGEEDRKVASGPQEIKDWYRCRGDPRMASKLMEIFTELFPDLKALSYRTDSCLASHTASYRPYIDLVSPTIGVALGGCDCGAKSSDEIGRLASRLMLDGKWDSELPKEEFKYRVSAKKNFLPPSNL